MAGFVKAKREKVWCKIQIGGTSGSGKTFSALRLATGIEKHVGGGIAFISSEKSRSLYYADKFEYDILELDDYSPENYINAIDTAIDAGYKVIIIDSTSHEWQWLNDVHSKMPGNSFTNWAPLKARHAKFMQKILQCPAHIITCARGKTEWAMQDKNGKQVPVKVGLGNEGDKQADFEYTVSFALAQGTHIASVGDGGKDNTGLFEGKYEVLTEKHGEMLYEWANSGEAPASVPKVTIESATDSAAEELSSLHKLIIDKCIALGGQKNTSMMAVVKEYTANGNPKFIKSIEKAKELLDRLTTMEAANE